MSSSVYPSGAALATDSAAIVPPPPGRVSISTCWPQASVSFCPKMRATMSGPVPRSPGWASPGIPVPRRRLR